MDYMDNVSKRIVSLREEKGETQQELANAVGITRQSLSRYEIAARTVSVEVLGALAQHFNVSADYLLGLSDVKSTEQDMQTACEVTGLSEYAISAFNELKKEPCFDIVDKLFSSCEDYETEELLEEAFSNCMDEVKVEAFASAFCELAGTDIMLSDDGTSAVLLREILIEIQSYMLQNNCETENNELLFRIPLQEYEIEYQQFCLQKRIMDSIECLSFEYKESGNLKNNFKKMYLQALKNVFPAIEKYIKQVKEHEEKVNTDFNDFLSTLFRKESPSEILKKEANNHAKMEQETTE